MVGQDLGTLDRYCDWIKVMSYGHALAPAGIPFELLALANWLVDDKGFDETQALALLSRATHLPLPRNRIGLQKEGVPPAALKLEAQRARTAGVKIVLAGIELVEVEGITVCARRKSKPIWLHSAKQTLRAWRCPGTCGKSRLNTWFVYGMCMPPNGAALENQPTLARRFPQFPGPSL
jgi:hypothetical protein